MTKSGSSQTFVEPIGSEDESNTPPARSKSSAGWKWGLIIGASSCLLVFAINVGVAIWSSTLPPGYPDENHARRVLMEGSCSEMRKYNVVLHFIINIFSSVLLAASNYGMQCLSAPTRADVDKAHFRGKWMDIGIPSIRNLYTAPGKRVVPWTLLLLSSVPLHLFYNSVIFLSLSATDYMIASVNETAIPASTFSLTFDQVSRTPQFQNTFSDNAWIGDNLTQFHWIEDLWNSARDKRLEKLTTSECIDKYGTAFQTRRSHILLVSDNSSDPNWQGIPCMEFYVNCDDPNPYDWICRVNSGSDPGSGNCRSRLPSMKIHAENWTPFGTQIKYCLSKPVTEHCRLNFSPPLISIIIICNALKAAVLLYTALRPPAEPLLVLGDAIESFLTTPDPFSVESCLVSACDLGTKNKKNWTGPRECIPTRKRWASAVTMRRWEISILLYSAALVVSLIYLVWGILRIHPHDFKSLWDLGFGAVTDVTLIALYGNPFQADARIILMVLLANLPQFFFSILYFQYNALFTGMLAAKEWSSFGYKRKGLRVSSEPKEYQRSRYFLQLPYRWSIPLILMSILIHWMLSQSIFVVAIENVNSKTPTLYSTCGYSPIAIITVVLASGVMMLAVIITGFRRLSSSIPVVGSCSLAIAAACHHPTGAAQPEEPFLPLKWGVICDRGEVTDARTVGHCGFSSEYVEEPQAGAQYA